MSDANNNRFYLPNENSNGTTNTTNDHILSADYESCQSNRQLLLEPECKSTVGLCKRLGPIPLALREFGRFPDTSRWQIGDLILFSQVDPDYGSRAIARVQENFGYASEDARWHHAAVYMDRNYICDATPFGGVRYRKIYPYIGRYVLRVRRDLSLSCGERTQIAVKAESHLRRLYSLRILARIAAQSSRRLLLGHFKDTWPKKFGLVCSTLYADAYYKATSKTLQDPASGEIIETVTPAFLSYTPRLVDIESEWLSIA